MSTISSPNSAASVSLEELLDERLETSLGEQSQLIVYNDDINTFDWVIESLMEICNHGYIQAEQLAMLVHFKGKATVKTSTHDQLSPMKDALVERGISAVIETYAR